MPITRGDTSIIGRGIPKPGWGTPKNRGEPQTLCLLTECGAARGWRPRATRSVGVEGGGGGGEWGQLWRGRSRGQGRALPPRHRSRPIGSLGCGAAAPVPPARLPGLGAPAGPPGAPGGGVSLRTRPLKTRPLPSDWPRLPNTQRPSLAVVSVDCGAQVHKPRPVLRWPRPHPHGLLHPRSHALISQKTTPPPAQDPATHYP